MVFLMVEWRRSSMFGEVNIAQELLSLVTLFVGRYMALIPPSCECATNWAGVEMLSWANHEFENSLTKNVSRPASLSDRHWLQANSSSSLQSSLLFFKNFFRHFFLEVGLVHFFLCRCSEAGRFWFWGGLPDRVGVWRVVWVFAPEKLQTLWSSVSESL